MTKKYLFLIILSFFFLGCQHQNADNNFESFSNNNCRQVEHSEGMTCIPENWESLVSVDFVTAENAIALGIKPMGTPFSGLTAHLEKELSGIANIGRLGEPNLEMILQLQPDLIVGTDYQATIYPQLSQIAPTVLINFAHSGQWKAVFKEFSEVIGKKEVGEQVMAEYDRRIADFKEKMGDRLQDTEISIVRIYPDSINLYLRDSFPGTIITDAGLQRPESQDIGADEAQRMTGNPIQRSISKEALSQADGDVIFIWTGENDPQINAELQEKLDELQQDPLWQNLKAVKNGRVYQVPSYWIGSGAIAANLVLDDLFKYLIPEETN